ncbi:glycerophosphodiester phosphodiesterase [Hydrogenimonas sp.]
MRFYDSFKKEHLIAGHRGWRTIRPENTLSAFEAAVGHFDFIELDLRLSRDGHYVVMHDATLERTTDAAEVFPQKASPRYVADYTLSQLRQLDAGRWFLQRDPFSTLANGKVAVCDIERLLPQKIPTIEEVLTFGRTSGMPLNLEIKDMPHRDEHEVVDLFLRSLGPISEAPTLIVSSFNRRYLQILKKKAPAVPTALLVAKSLPDPLMPLLERLGVEACHADRRLADRVPVRSLSRNKIASALYTVNDAAQRKAYFKQGFRALFSDIP